MSHSKIQKPTWEGIWRSKQTREDLGALGAYEVLEELLRLNGFDTKSGTFRLEDYLKFVHQITQKARLEQCDGVFEVGCGAGAFLYALELARGLDSRAVGGGI